MKNKMSLISDIVYIAHIQAYFQMCLYCEHMLR